MKFIKKENGNGYWLQSKYKYLIVNLHLKVYGLGFNIIPFKYCEMNCISIDLTLILFKIVIVIPFFKPTAK